MAIVILFPIYYMISISLKLPKDIYRTPSLLPLNATLQNYVDLFGKMKFLINIRNSVIVAGAATIISVFISCMAAYSLVRLKYRFRDWIGRLILFTYLTPGALLFISLAVIINRLRLGNTVQGLIFVYLTFSAPLSTWLLMGYFRSIPADLEEQAMVDGVTRWQALFRSAAAGHTRPHRSQRLHLYRGLERTAAGAHLHHLAGQADGPRAVSYLITGDVFRWG
ncbi:MAG: carbohydrate ABC transporter permease [Caldilineaceae bacterium]